MATNSSYHVSVLLKAPARVSYCNNRTILEKLQENSKYRKYKWIPKLFNISLGAFSWVVFEGI